MKLVALAYYLLASALAVTIIVNSSAASRDYDEMYEYFTPANQVDMQVKQLLETLSFGLYGGTSVVAERIQETMRSAEQHNKKADWGGWTLLGLSALFLLLNTTTARNDAARWQVRIATHVLGVSAVFLVIGLCAPILTLVAYTEVAVLGKVVFKYESKAILSTVVDLVRSGNIFIAVILFTFSVVTPLAKLVLSLLALRAPDATLRRRTVAIIATVGKWSMADVLVVAVLLSFFVAGSDQFTDSWLGQGLYFFAGYCILALVVGHLIAGLDKRPAATT